MHTSIWPSCLGVRPSSEHRPSKPRSKPEPTLSAVQPLRQLALQPASHGQWLEEQRAGRGSGGDGALSTPTFRTAGGARGWAACEGPTEGDACRSWRGLICRVD